MDFGAAKEKIVARKIIRSLAVAIPVVVLVGAVTLSLLGYGVALAIESTFGIPRDMSYSSPLGLLHLASYAIGGWIDCLGPLVESEKFQRFALVMAGFGIILTIPFLVYRYRVEKRKKGLVRGYGLKRRFSQNIFARFFSGFGRWFARERLYLLPFFAFASGPWLVVGAFTLLSLIFAFLPLIGQGMAARYFYSWTISADYCTPISSRADWLDRKNLDESGDVGERVKVTTCLSLWRGDSFVAEGRHVASTDKNIILFDPMSGSVHVESTDGISVRVSGMPAKELRKLIENARSGG